MVAGIMDGISLGPLFNNIGVAGLCVVLMLMFASDRIVSGKRLKKAEADRDRWQVIALESIKAGAVLVPAAETVNRLVSAFPDPDADTGRESP